MTSSKFSYLFTKCKNARIIEQVESRIASKNIVKRPRTFHRRVVVVLGRAVRLGAAVAVTGTARVRAGRAEQARRLERSETQH